MSVQALSANNQATAASSQEKTESTDIYVDTTRFTGCSYEEFEQMVLEGLEGKDAEFFKRIEKRGIKQVFNLNDEDGNGVLSKNEAQTVSSIGINQMKKGQGGSSWIENILNNIGNMSSEAFQAILASSSNTFAALSTSTGNAIGIAGGVAASAINFAMQFNQKSGDEMAGAMSATGYHAGEWCADFVYYCMKNAFNAAGKALPEGYESINHAYCPSIAQWARETGRAFSDPSQAKPGDLLIMSSEGHIGIVTKVDSQGIHTIEGNTSGSSGYGSGGYVSDKVRDFGCVSTFVRMS